MSIFSSVVFVIHVGHLHLVKSYMVAVKRNNVAFVNEDLNEIYVEEEDYDRLRESIDMHNNFDQIGLSQRVRGTSLLVLSFKLKWDVI